MDIPRPEDVESILSSAFVVMYWPMILATPVFLLAVAKGHNWIAVPVAAIGLALQAGRLGLIGGG
jgi:hypothetical protein